MACDALKLSSAAKELSRVEGPRAYLAQRKLIQGMAKYREIHNLGTTRGRSSSPGYGILLDAKNSRVHVLRRSVDLKKLDAPLGIFKTNPYSLSANPTIRAFMKQYSFLDQVMAASSDGNWVATGTHVFNARNFTVHKEIPIPTPVLGFSKDSKALYYFDWVNKVIAPLELGP